MPESKNTEGILLAKEHKDMQTIEKLMRKHGISEFVIDDSKGRYETKDLFAVEPSPQSVLKATHFPNRFTGILSENTYLKDEIQNANGKSKGTFCTGFVPCSVVSNKEKTGGIDIISLTDRRTPLEFDISADSSEELVKKANLLTEVFKLAETSGVYLDFSVEVPPKSSKKNLKAVGMYALFNADNEKEAKTARKIARLTKQIFGTATKKSFDRVFSPEFTSGFYYES